MATERKFTGKKLPLIIAFTVLLVAAFGAGCNGFFVPPTLTSITINPTAPSVLKGDTTTLQAFGVNSNGNGAYLTSGVSWSTSDVSIATVTGTGSATLSGVGIGQVTITATAQSVTNTANATVYIQISAMDITPNSASFGTDGQLDFLVYANNDPTLQNPDDNLSTTATLTVTLNGTAVSTISCSVDDTVNPVQQLCSATGAAAGNYVITATNPGTTLTATAKLTITP